MTPTMSTSVRRAGRLVEILLGYLEAAGVLPWPGADGLTLDDVLRSYPEAAAEGLVPDQAALRSKHPELAGEIDAFFQSSIARRFDQSAGFDWPEFSLPKKRMSCSSQPCTC